MLNTSLLYLRHSRYAWVSWPIILVPVAAWLDPAFSLLAVVSIYSRCRFYWLLPYEKKWLRLAQVKIRELNSAAAVELLNEIPLFTGYTARLRAQMLHVRALLNSGKELAAQELLFNVDTSGMTSGEKASWQRLLAAFYLQTGDIKAFLEVTRAWDKAQVLKHTENTLLKAQALQEEGDLISAREHLEARIERERKSENLLSLYSDLATISGMVGRRGHQLEYLETAWQHWCKAPRPEAMYYLAHNLAINRVRDGQRDAAKRVLHETYGKLDKDNPEQILMWHNLCVEVAREAGDGDWLKQSRLDLAMHCKALELTAPEQLSLAITQLRMDLNDGLVAGSPGYLDRINVLLDSIHILDTLEQPSALREITHNLEQMLDRVPKDRRTRDLFLAVYSRCDQMMLDRTEIITEQLRGLAPTLINRRQFWLSLQHYVHKIHIRRSEGVNERALASLFQTQKESAELYQEKGVISEALQAWVVICDEYVAYMQQFPSDMQSRLKEKYESLALDALLQAENLLDRRKITIGLESYMIGAAYFSLRLRSDHRRAQYWIGQFNHSGMRLNQYAVWLRSQYDWVQSVLLRNERLGKAVSGSKCNT